MPTYKCRSLSTKLIEFIHVQALVSFISLFQKYHKSWNVICFMSASTHTHHYGQTDIITTEIIFLVSNTRKIFLYLDLFLHEFLLRINLLITWTIFCLSFTALIILCCEWKCIVNLCFLSHSFFFHDTYCNGILALYLVRDNEKSRRK